MCLHLPSSLPGSLSRKVARISNTIRIFSSAIVTLINVIVTLITVIHYVDPVMVRHFRPALHSGPGWGEGCRPAHPSDQEESPVPALDSEQDECDGSY